MSAIRSIIANNASPMTLDGTRTYIVGDTHIALIDPGPLLEEHLDAVADAVGDGASITILLTHSHPDHAEGAAELARRLGSNIRDVQDGDIVQTDAGALRALATPGHTSDHFSFHLPSEDAVFCGDLMMGGLDTALVALPEGNLRHYLQSLQKLRALRPRIIYPAHGDAFHDPAAAIALYVKHREERLKQVDEAMRAGVATRDALVDRIYGSGLDPQLRAYAASAIEAYMEYLN